MQVEGFPFAVGQYDNLLQLPTIAELEMVESQEGYLASIQRRTAEKYKNTSERFAISQRTFEEQYSNIYFKRLEALKADALATAHKNWNQHKKLKVIEKLLDIQEDERCILVGTLYKEMPLVPRVLDQFTTEV